ncbi:hypothetical protein UlMin_018103 [Ulmus minor]
MEDKDKDFFLIDISLSTQPISSTHSPHESIPPQNCEKQSTNNDVSVLDNMRFGKVYSRKKSSVPAPEQVQDSNLKTENEVTVSNSNSNSCTELESLAENKLNHDLPIAVRKKTREYTKHPLYPLSHFVSFEKFSSAHRNFLISLNTIFIPTTIFEALSNENWKQAMNVEMEALEKNKTWDLVNLPAGKKPVCKLRKALYGLKQSPRVWFGRFSKAVINMGYKQSQEDHTLFIKHSNLGGVIVLLVYVDDIIVMGDDERESQFLRKCLAKEFEIKELGRPKYFIGIEFAHSRLGIFISQQKYITDLLKETGKLACRPASTLINPNFKLGEAEEDYAMNRESYQCLVGKLIYLSHTRPDIAYVVSVVSQFMQSPKEIHLQAVH